MNEWVVGGTLALIGIAYVVWDIRNSSKRGRRDGDGGGDGDSGGDGGDGGD